MARGGSGIWGSRTKGDDPIVIKVGEGPVWAKRWRSLPQIPPAVTATRAQAALGRSGSARSAGDAGKAGSARSNGTARPAVTYALGAAGGARRPGGEEGPGVQSESCR